MLSDQTMELLTAFVDGEMSQRQRESVMRLLNQSSEARDFVKQLQENAHKLKSLPQHKVEPSLVDDILSAIAAQKAELTPPAPSTRGVRRRWLPYVAASMAASLLIAVIGYVFWISRGEPDDPNKVGPGPVAINKDDAKKNDPKKPPEKSPSPKVRQQDPRVLDFVQNTFKGFDAYVPPPQAFTAKFDDLRDPKGAVAANLVKEIKTAKSGVQLDITIKGNADPMARLQHVLKTAGITVVADPAVIRNPKDKAPPKKIEFVVYVENLTSEEVTKLMSELGDSFMVSDNGKNQRSVNNLYQRVAVKPFAKEDRLNLVKLMGTDPIEDDMKITNPERKRIPIAVLMPATPSARPSPEIKSFSNLRVKPQPGTLQIVIRIHD